MSDYVTLHHPKLPADQTIRVHRDRIDARLASGWEVVAPAPAETKPNEPETAPAAGETKPTESAPKRRGRNSNEEQ